MKLLIFVCLTVGGILGAWLGSQIDNGNMFGFWGFLLGWLIGPLLGVLIGYKIGKAWLE